MRILKWRDYKRYVKTLILTIGLAFLTLYIAFGLMFLAIEGNPVPGSFILLSFAFFFIIFTVFYESKAKERLKSLIKGLFIGICATFSLVAVIGGVCLTIDHGFELIGGLGSFISALAICMIASMVFLTLLRPS
ncbi:MAG: hypothetical protein ACXQTW_01115 [Candidatus Methanospirareceae archaeon]